MAPLHRISIAPTNDGLLAECQLCGQHKSYRQRDDVTLAELVADMSDHLARNHPDSQ